MPLKKRPEFSNLISQDLKPDIISQGLYSKEEIDTRRRKIDYKLLEHNTKNHYALENIEDLADSIENFGLLQDLLVKEDNGKYIIISGHRRYEAIKVLVEQRGLAQFRYIDCFLNDAGEDETITDIKLEISNILTRELSEYDKMIAIENLRNLINKAKSNGFEIKGRMRDFIGEQINLSPTQTQRYLKVIDQGSDQIKSDLRDKKITLSSAIEMIDYPEPAEIAQPEGAVKPEDDPYKINGISDLIDKAQRDAPPRAGKKQEYESSMLVPTETKKLLDNAFEEFKSAMKPIENPYMTRLLNLLKKHLDNIKEV